LHNKNRGRTGKGAKFRRWQRKSSRENVTEQRAGDSREGNNKQSVEQEGQNTIELNENALPPPSPPRTPALIMPGSADSPPRKALISGVHIMPASMRGRQDRQQRRKKRKAGQGRQAREANETDRGCRQERQEKTGTV
jgi:hypothetical protein